MQTNFVVAKDSSSLRDKFSIESLLISVFIPWVPCRFLLRYSNGSRHVTHVVEAIAGKAEISWSADRVSKRI